MFTDDRTRPRHLSTGKCLCQFIEEHFRNQTISELQCEQANKKHNQPATTISPYSNTKATLLINGKEQQHHLKTAPTITLQERHQIISKKKFKKHYKARSPDGRALPEVVIAGGKPERLARDLEIGQANNSDELPSISRMVSLKEANHLKENHHRLSIERMANDSGHHQITAQQHPQSNQNTHNPAHLQANGFAANLWPQYYAKQPSSSELEDSYTASPTVASQSTSNSAEVSLEMGSDLIGRSDDLVRKLRLLLELRKNELQGIDGSLFSAVLYKAPQQFSTSDQEANQHHQDPTSLDDQTNGQASATAVGSDSNNGPIVKSGGGRKFYQREGLFFLGSGGGKKSQQHQQQQQQQQQQTACANQVLEIC